MSSYQSVKSFYKPSGAKAGITITKVNSTDCDALLQIKAVTPGGLADQAGLRSGHQILAINNKTDLSCEEAGQILQDADCRIEFLVQTPPEFNKVFYKRSKGTYVGIALADNQRTGDILIGHVTPGSIAQAAGLCAGQSVVAINGVLSSASKSSELKELLDEATGVVNIAVEPTAKGNEEKKQKKKKRGPQPPKGVKNGGIWGELTYHGESTDKRALVGFVCLGLPGVLAAANPVDKRDAYLLDGMVYSREGKCLGKVEQLKFKALKDHPRNHLHPLDIMSANRKYHSK